MAKNSLKESDRATWLRLAQEWMPLLRPTRGDETPQVDQKDWPADQDEGPGTSH